MEPIDTKEKEAGTGEPQSSRETVELHEYASTKKDHGRTRDALNTTRVRKLKS